MKILFCLTVLILLSNITIAQKKISFNNKKLSELNLNLGYEIGYDGISPTIPNIWKDFDIDSDNFVFSGYYTLCASSDNDNKILNGEVKIHRIQYHVAEGTMHLKEELTFNFDEGLMNGPVSYIQYSAESNGEPNEIESNDFKWKKEITISANFNSENLKYTNIKFFEQREWENTKYSIVQESGYDISINYFRTVININTAPPEEKPVFEKIK